MKETEEELWKRVKDNVARKKGAFDWNNLRAVRLTDEDIKEVAKAFSQEILNKSLPAQDQNLRELEKQIKQRQDNQTIDLYKKEGYISGFCDGFRHYQTFLELLTKK